jgi:hypothetical protein
MSSNPLALGVTRPRPARNNFFLLMALACGLTVAIGFAPSYYLRALSDQPPLSLLVQVHGLAFSLWIALFLGQSLLIRQRRLALHRALGIAGLLLAVVMLYSAGAVAIHQAAARYAAGRMIVGFPALQFLALQLGDLLEFGVLVTLGVLLRRHPQAHKRLLLLATLCIIAPAIGRMPLPPLAKFLLPVAAVAGCMAWDLLRHRRLHPVFLWGGLAFMACIPLRMAIGATAPWQAFARWLIT